MLTTFLAQKDRNLARKPKSGLLSGRLVLFCCSGNMYFREDYDIVCIGCIQALTYIILYYAGQ